MLETSSCPLSSISLMTVSHWPRSPSSATKILILLKSSSSRRLANEISQVIVAALSLVYAIQHYQ